MCQFRRVCVALLLPIIHATRSHPTKFLIVSTPRTPRIYYMKVSHGDLRYKPAAQMQPLIDTGLVHPQGLALDQRRSQLYVADPDSRRIFAYPLSASTTSLTAGEPVVCADNVEARWVTLDGHGNLFFSDEPQNQILKISALQLAAGDMTPTVVYDGKDSTQVSFPGGVAVDALHAYWVNKQAGIEVGSLIEAPVAPSATRKLASGSPSPATQGRLDGSMMALSKVADKSYGVCLAPQNIYFTQPEATLIGVRKDRSHAATISNRLRNPRGCAWDGDGTVYVADRGAGAVFSFAANMPELSAVQLTKTADLEDAFGVAIFSTAAPRWRFSQEVIVLTSLLLALPSMTLIELH